MIPDSDEDDMSCIVVVFIGEFGVLLGELGDTTSKRDAQLPGAMRDRLLRALAGTDMSGLKIGLVAADARLLLGSGMNW